MHARPKPVNGAARAPHRRFVAPAAPFAAYLFPMKRHESIGIAVGITIGAAIGAMLDNLVMGIAIGVAFGLAMGPLFKPRDSEK
jgi:hypothetical protein